MTSRRIPDVLSVEAELRGHDLYESGVRLAPDGTEIVRWDCQNDDCRAVLVRRGGRYYGGAVQRVCGARPVTRRWRYLPKTT